MKSRFVFLLIIILLTSCTQPLVPQEVAVPPETALHLYLQPLPRTAHGLQFTISAINACRSSGEVIRILEKPLKINAGEVLDRQIKILSSQLPPGEYLGLNLVIPEASIGTESGTTALLIKDNPQYLQQKFIINQGQSETLFLTLQPERLVTSGYLLTAQFALRGQPVVLPKLKGVVSHPVNGTLAFIEKLAPSVVSTLNVGEFPTGLGLDKLARRAYVALTGEYSIAAIDMVQEQIQKKVWLRTADKPTDIALTEDGRTLVAISPDTYSVSIFDADFLLERDRLVLPSRPEGLFVSANGRFAYVMQPEANALTIVDLNRAEVISSMNFPEAVAKGVASHDGRHIYLIAEDSPDLLVVEAQGLHVIRRVHIGNGASCLAVDNEDDRVYVGRGSAVAVVDSEVGFPIDLIETQGVPVDVVVDDEDGHLFVLTAGGKRLEKFDMVSHKLLGSLDFDSAGYEVLIMGD